MPNLNVADLTGAWTSLVECLGLGPRRLKSVEDHSRLVGVLDELLAATRESVEHPLSGLIELLADLVEDFESQSLHEPNAPPADVLRLLMDSADLKQTDLAEEVGGQPVVSAILNGRRQINAKQAAALAARFGVSPAVFIAKASPPRQPTGAIFTKRSVARQARFSGPRLYTRENAVTKESGVVTPLPKARGLSVESQSGKLRVSFLQI